ncbi:S9 family peptidase [Sphingomonas sp. ASV193]|uniref:S9 family peptidase n=1 Tax=Sphingomonas sp. ASV193 TaxID=3144405 RepID=UPI0032E8940D
MIRPSLLAAAAAAALSATPALSRPMTITDLQSLHRLGGPSVAPDGRHAIFTLSETDWKANKRKNRLYLLDLARPGAEPVPLAGIGEGHDAVFGADGAIWYLAPVKGQDQLFRKTLTGAPVQLSTLEGDISGFKIAKDGSRVVLFADRDLRCPDFACQGVKAAGLGGSGRVYDQLFVRHWDAWSTPGVKSRLFAFPIAGGKVVGKGVPVSAPLVGDTPSKPFGGSEEIDLSPDGKTVYFAMREAGRIEPTSTNLDIFAVPADGSAAPRNLTADNRGTDNIPTVSPDGRTLAWLSMARAGYEADRNVIKLMDLASGRTRALTGTWDRSPDSLAWTPDGRALVVTAGDTLEEPIFRVDVATGAVTRLTGDGHFGAVTPLRDGSIVATMNSASVPDDLYRIAPGGQPVQLTAVNKALLAQLDPVSFTKFNFKGANNDTVWGFVMKPAGPQYAAAKLPISFLVHGGPQGSFSNSWSYRWNPRLFTAPGYAAVSVDFHGSTGYGQAFTDAIHNNWGGWPLEDLQKGLAFAVSRDPQLDGSRACALGGSYGGYMMNWIEGRWPDRFRCIVQHDGVFDARAMAYETEELWFDEWEHGGKTYYEDPAAFERWNPVNYVSAWRTPQLVITSEKDFRIPYTQGLAAFTALQRRGIPSKLLIFPDENHWVLKPKNSVQWYDNVFAWEAQWLNR